MKKFQKNKLNNSGSTLVFVVIALVFIGLLASLILALSAASFRMKNIDYSSRKNFYEGEEYSGKIYTDLGMNSIGILGEAYTEAMGKISSGAITSKTALNDYLKKAYYKEMMLYLGLVKKDLINDANETILNAQLMAPELVYSPKSSDIAEKQKVEAVRLMLQKIVDRVEPNADGTAGTPDPDKIPTVKIYGDIVCKPEGGTYEDGTTYPTIQINDVHLEYVNSDTNFESNYTFDIVIKFPKWDFTYSNPVSERTDIDSFVDFVFISEGALKFAQNGAVISVKGCVAAGDNSLTAANNNDNRGIFINYCTVNFNANDSNWYEKFVAVATDNIVVNSSASFDGVLNINNGKVWCNSIILNRDATVNASTHHSTVTAGTDVEVYLQDDLQLDGIDSRVSMTGSYLYAYGTNTTDGGMAQDTSSSVIVNGYNSSINLNQMKGLYVYGLSYLDIPQGGSYRTGESLSIKTNQDIYLVPAVYLEGATSNPTSTYLSDEQLKLVADNLKNNTEYGEFFGYQYLKDGKVRTVQKDAEGNIVYDAGGNPVYVTVSSSLPSDQAVIRRSYTNNKGKTYYFYYLNFDTPFAQSHYVSQVLGDTALANKNQEAIRTELKDRAYENLTDNLSQDGVNYVLSYNMANDGVAPFTVGAMITARGGTDKNSSTVQDKAEAAMLADATTAASRYRKRYRLAKSLLIDVAGSSETLDDYNSVLCKDLAVTTVGKRNYNSSEFNKSYRNISNLQLTRSVITNMINLAKLDAYAKSDGGNVWDRSHSGVAGGTATLRYVSAGSTPYVLSDFRGVLVVDGSVQVNGNVEGLVIATGQITVTGGSTFTSNPEMVHQLLTLEQTADSIINNDDPRSDVFYFYPTDHSSAVAGKNVAELDYSDVIYFDNWRRYEDSN